MVYVLAVGFLGTFAGLGLIWVAVLEAVKAFEYWAKTPVQPGLVDRLRELEHAQAMTVQKVENDLQKTIRAEARTRAIVKGVRQQLDEAGLEHPSIEAEAEQLQLVDGDGSDGGRVQPVPANVAVAAPPNVDGEEDWEVATKKKKYGF